jgi:hypothetical protein
VADKAKKPKNDENDYDGPEHGYVFRLSLLSAVFGQSLAKQSSKKLAINAKTSRDFAASDKS